MAERSNSGTDYTLKLGLDTSATEKAQKRVEAILKRTQRVERLFNSERVSAATKLLSLETRIAAQRVKGISKVAAAQNKQIMAQQAAANKAAQQAARPARRFQPAVRPHVIKSSFISSNSRTNLENKMDELKQRMAGAQIKGLLDPDAITATTARLDQLKQKLTQVGGSNPVEFQRLSREFSKINKEIGKTISNTERSKRAFDAAQFAVGSFVRSIGSLVKSFASIFLLIDVATFFVNLTKGLETAEVALLNAAGSAEQAGKDFNFVKKISNELGLELISTAEAFGKFGAASKLGGMTADETREVFTNISKAVAGAALSQERAGLVFQAFQQIMSKGVLSMEEVRQQIGESLPQGMAALSTATGKTGTELFKFIESGQAISKDILPIWAKELARLSEDSGALAKSGNTLNAAWNRFKNTLTELLTVFSDLSGGNFLASLLDVGSDLVSTFSELLKILRNILLIFGLIDKQDPLGKTAEKANLIKRTITAMTAGLYGFIGQLKLMLGIVQEFTSQWSKVGFIEAFSETAKVLQRSNQIAFERMTAKGETTRILKQGGYGYTVNMTNNIQSTDPKVTAQEIEKISRKTAKKFTQLDQKAAF